MARKARKTVRAAADQAREALFAAAKKIGPDDDRVGDLVIYDLNPGFKVSVDKARKVFSSFGLDPDHVLPCPPDWNVAFGRALESVGAKIRGRDFELKAAAKGPNGERRMAVCKVFRNGEVTVDDRGTVVCPTSKVDEPPYVERADRAGFASSIIAAAKEYHEVYTLDDIRVAVVQHIDRCYGLPLRRTPPYVGYWVPTAGTAEIEKLRDAIEELEAGDIDMGTFYASDPKSQRLAVNTVNKGLEAQLNEFKAEVDEYVNKPAESTRVSKMEDLISQAQTLRERGALYRDILGAAVQSVEREYKAVEKTLKKHLGIVEEAHEEVA